MNTPQIPKTQTDPRFGGYDQPPQTASGMEGNVSDLSTDSSVDIDDGGLLSAIGDFLSDLFS